MKSQQEIKNLGSTLVPRLADLSWRAIQLVNSHIPAGKLPTPAWAPGRLMKSKERTSPPLGVPRTTQSLCPKCCLEARDAILRGKEGVDTLKD